jgi:DNA polymerase-4
MIVRSILRLQANSENPLEFVDSQRNWRASKPKLEIQLLPMRTILHVDMDAFFASIEQRDFPELRGRSVIVGGAHKRGVVSTASYEARAFGVHSALPMSQARRRCPHAVVRPVRMAKYQQVSLRLMEILGNFSPVVEPLSLDEAFLDMTGTRNLFGTPHETAKRIISAIQEKMQLPCSVGIASNKFLAKLASDLDKPDGLTWIPFGHEREFIAPLSIRKLWGVGPKTAQRIEKLGMYSIGAIADADPFLLSAELGELGRHIHALARGVDPRPVVKQRKRKSLGSERTFEQDLVGRDEMERHILVLCNKVAKDLRGKSIKARSIRVKIRYSESFQLVTRDGGLKVASDDSRALFSAAKGLLEKFDLESKVRLVGIIGFDLVEDEQWEQRDLFAQAGVDRNSKLEKAMDAINKRFGEVAFRGSK